MKHLPNILTLANLFCGSIACIFAIINAPTSHILYLLIASLVFDFFDGFVARAVRASGPLGKELDSLADMVTFGLLPGILMFKLLGGNLILNSFLSQSFTLTAHSIFPFFGLLITLFSALRLAKFNLDEEQSYYFKGLPTPANTIFIFAIYWIIEKNSTVFWNNSLILFFLTILSSYILVANLPLLALKFKSLKLKDNSLVFSFIILCLVLLLLLQISAIPIIVLLYIIISILFRKKIISNGTKTT
ncbi:phosphatidylcholine/phosphatidylserine synthase [Apibacter sp. HY039]|uniref:CDP-alcohol phosphatidyltransferase family protein n=1 Tax=Apibacter sp. HY039 TaxID=2501476 RepID=UPI000FEBF994|nr:CDP-alcohol phosphatidyltransferase family protein [Apibacter sp. HY039]